MEDALSELLRRGAREMLAQANEEEVEQYVQAHAGVRDGDGRRLVVRNGYMPEREIQTSLGNISVRKPRVNDRRVDEDGQRIRFSSKILPRIFGVPRRSSSWRRGCTSRGSRPASSRRRWRRYWARRPRGSRRTQF